MNGGITGTIADLCINDWEGIISISIRRHMIF